jgi:hypothetical protein
MGFPEVFERRKASRHHVTPHGRENLPSLEGNSQLYLRLRMSEPSAARPAGEPLLVAEGHRLLAPGDIVRCPDAAA